MQRGPDATNAFVIILAEKICKLKMINFDAVNNCFTDVSAKLPSSGYKTIRENR